MITQFDEYSSIEINDKFLALHVGHISAAARIENLPDATIDALIDALTKIRDGRKRPVKEVLYFEVPV